MPRRVLSGVVVSAKSEKTVHVKVERKFKHPKYHKIVRVTKKYAAHDPNSLYKEGDLVDIVETSPISKTKKWAVISK